MSRQDQDPMDIELRLHLRKRAPAAGCPPEARWIALVGGELADEESEALRSHLADCAACTAVAVDARRFRLAMDSPRASPGSARFRRWTVAASAAAAAVAMIATAVGVLRKPVERAPSDPVAALVAAFEPPALPAGDGDTAADELIYRGSGSSAGQRSLAEALAPYRDRDFATACGALAGHGRRFPSDREARFLAAAACLKAGEVERSEALLASLAAVAGDRRDDARALRERLLRARRSAPR